MSHEKAQLLQAKRVLRQGQARFLASRTTYNLQANCPSDSIEKVLAVSNDLVKRLFNNKFVIRQQPNDYTKY